MKFLSLAPFVPSGSDHEGSKQLFGELSFRITWDSGDYTGFEKDGCSFILQKFNNREFAENLMITIQVSNVQEFWNEVTEKNLAEKYGIRLSPPTPMPYGLEVNLIDMAGVCWHFVE